MKRLFICTLAAFMSVYLWGSEPFTGNSAFQRAHIGIYVVEKESGKAVFAQQAEAFFVPASVAKIVTGVAALNALGKEHTFVTELGYDGAISPDGVLHGNVWIRGGGDPTLSLEIIEEWERALRGHMIRMIDGKVIVDASCYETVMASPYWLFEDLGNYYGAGPSGMTIHRNLYYLTFKPGAQLGDPAIVASIDPPIPGLIFHNEVTTAAAGTGDRVVVYGSEYSQVQYYRGTVPIDQPTFTVKAAMPDPPLFCAQQLAQKLQPTQGYRVVREKESNPAPLHVIHRYASPSLKEIILRMNVASDNLYAEHLLKAIGQGKAAEGSVKMEQMLQARNIPAQVKDGAGLARVNMLSPKGVVELLLAERESIYETLPELVLAPDVIVKAKSGTMSGICNLAGYLKSPSGKEYVFAIFCNNYQGSLKDVRAEMAKFLMSYAKS